MVRSATAADQAAINRIVRSAGINPFGLHWRRFVVAEANGVVVGTGQIRTHGDGSRELASIAVTPAHRGQGVARSVIEALLARRRDVLFLICRGELEPMYACTPVLAFAASAEPRRRRTSPACFGSSNACRHRPFG